MEEVRKRKWRLAGHTARRTDGRWSTAMLQWTPDQGKRNRGHPLKRWGDGLQLFDKFVDEQSSFDADNADWTAQCREMWTYLEADFANKCWV